MALTKGFKFVCVSIVAAGLVAGYVYWKGHHVPAAAPVEAIDTGNAQQPTTDTQAPVAQPPAVAPVQETPTQPPVYQQEAQPAQSTDASNNRGMQFLLNQGKKQ